MAVRVHACVRACVRARVCACVRAYFCFIGYLYLRVCFCLRLYLSLHVKLGVEKDVTRLQRDETSSYLDRSIINTENANCRKLFITELEKANTIAEKNQFILLVNREDT